MFSPGAKDRAEQEDGMIATGAPPFAGPGSRPRALTFCAVSLASLITFGCGSGQAPGAFTETTIAVGDSLSHSHKTAFTTDPV